MVDGTRVSLTHASDVSPSLGETPVASWYTPGLSDALGDRLLLCDNVDGETLEMLRLPASFTTYRDFETRLRAQAQILKGFHSPSFAPIYSIERLEDSGNALAIVSRHVPGVRLSEVLNRSSPGRRALPVDAALFIVAQLTRAMAALHSHVDGLIHGALGTERVVLTAHGTVIIVEHALGAALAELDYDQRRFWTELRLGTVAGGSIGTIEPRTDVLQIALIALSTIVGRNLAPGDFPDRIDTLLSEVEVVLKKWPQFPSEPFLHWLERALQRSAAGSFRSAVEAANALSDWCDDSYKETSVVPVAHAKGSSARGAASSASSGFPAPIGLVTRSMPLSGGLPSFGLRRIPQNTRSTSRLNRSTWISVSVVAASLAVTLALVGIPTTAVLDNGLSTLVVTTVPSGATVRIDGLQIGVTPLRHMLKPGTYDLEVSKEGETRKSTIAMRRNLELNQYLEMTKVQPDQPAGIDSSWLAAIDVAVRPTSTRASATDAQSPQATTVDLTTGDPARLASLFVSSPIEVEVFHNGRLIGLSSMEEMSVPAGRLGTRSREPGARVSNQGGDQHPAGETTHARGSVAPGRDPGQLTTGGQRVDRRPPCRGNAVAKHLALAGTTRGCF